MAVDATPVLAETSAVDDALASTVVNDALAVDPASAADVTMVDPLTIVALLNAVEDYANDLRLAQTFPDVVGDEELTASRDVRV